MRASARSSDYCRRCRPSEDGDCDRYAKGCREVERIVAQASTLALTVDGRECESRYTVHPELRAAAPAVERWSRIFAQCVKWNFCLTAGKDSARESGETHEERARRNHSPIFKAKVALAAIKGD